MITWLNDVFSSTNEFMPHGACYLWLPSILWLHVISDAIIAVSYFTIPFALNYFVKRRKDLAFPRIFILFGAFILLCGITHLISIWTIWHPDYWLDGVFKLATAFVSLGSAIVIWRIMPFLLELPSPTAYKTKGIFMRAIFNASPDATIISNDQGKITMVNHQAEKLLGFKVGELIGQPIECIVSGINNAIVCDSAAYIAKKKDQTEIDVNISCNTIKTRQGDFLAQALRDVTKQKQTETALMESEERFRQLANNAATMIWVSDANGDFSFVNHYWRSLTGVDADNLTRSEWLALIHPDDRETTVISNPEHGHIGAVITSEYRIRGANGDWVWILDKGRVTYQDNVFNGYIGSAIDITERKQAEVDLYLAAAAFESQEPLIIADVNYIVLKANNAYIKLSGYKREEIVGQKMKFLEQDRHDKHFYESMWVRIVKTGFWQGEIWDRRKNGEMLAIWLTISAVKNNTGLVTHCVATYIDITKRKLVEDDNMKLAFYDPLTQLPNRRLLHDRLSHGIQRSKREKQQFALLMLDLDRFKDVNDTLGHQAGDELLKQVAERIKSNLRAVDMTARLGGDEFVVLLENIAKPEDAARVAERIVDDLSKEFQVMVDHEVWISVSIGISLYPQHGENLESLMTQADSAMYKAKEQGGGSIVYFSEDLTRSAHERINLEGRLRKAIPQNELRVFFQPQIDIASDRIIGAEALVRWQDPNEGLIPPGRFIPVAEETNLIVAIGEWVLNETCKQGRKWLDMGFPPITLAVNVSTQQFKRSDINALVIKVIADTGFPAGQLELEITESGLMKNQENAVDILNKLHEKGVRIAIDDFGTGYSSLAYLKRFPLDVLKIDKSFIDDIPHSKDDMEIAATIVAMAHNLGFKVIAEGVETKEQLEFLKLKGCDSYQGYFKSRPVPIDEFTKLMQEQHRSE
jgi:diguanylate cyclase (GGDEF)-like protein/PAS domain S-box-containing protein